VPFDAVLTKSARRVFVGETGFNFPRIGDVNIRIADHHDFEGSCQAGVRVDRDLISTLGRLSTALPMLVQPLTIT
jgi:ABC-type antimicrobial peptide transport system permease subunit